MAALRGGPIVVRVGVHTGEPGLDPPKYVGMDVHRAARIMACAHGGQAVLSYATRDLLEDKDELRDLGEHRLKDLSAPVRLYQLGDGDFPPLRSLYRTNLPVPATPFLGRREELAEIDDLLASDAVRLLTLTGPGGTGKTRLALQAAAGGADRYPDGVWWIALAPLRDPGLILPAVAEALEVNEQPGRDLSETLAERLAGKRTLLLFDNVEHLLPEAASAIAPLRGRDAPQLFVTSRERLQLEGEHVYPVPALVDSDAAALFTARARQLDPGFTPTPAVATLCTRLDNLPLAIELAAARTALFTVDELLGRLGQRLDLLRAGRDTDPRQQTLRATIDWSYQLLDPEDQRVYRALGIFAGGCTLESALQVCAAEADALESLLDKSLLRRRETSAGSRYWMLETIRQHAAELLAESGQRELMADRLAAWCLILAREADLVVSNSTETDRERLTADETNVMEAFEWALARDDGRCVRLGCGVTRLWFVRGFNERAWQAGHRALAFQGAADELDRACLMCWVSCSGYFLGEFEEARVLAEDALATLRAAGLERGVAWALQLSAGPMFAEGDTAGARAALDEAIEIARQSGESWPLTHLLNDRANVAIESGNLARARELLEEAVCLDPYPVPLTTLAEVELAEGRFEEARAYLARSIEVSGGHLLWLAAALACQAALEAATDAREQAVTLLGAADRIRNDAGAVHYGFASLTERRVSAAQALAASAAWKFAWEAGQAMSTDEAIAYALGSSEEANSRSDAIPPA
jgi:predicted ATPase